MVTERRFVQICESGPDYVCPSGDDSHEEFSFLDARRVSKAGTIHLLDVPSLLAQERTQERAARRAAHSSHSSAVHTTDEPDEPDDDYLDETDDYAGALGLLALDAEPYDDELAEGGLDSDDDDEV